MSSTVAPQPQPQPMIRHLYSVERYTLLVAAVLCATGLFALSRQGALSVTVGAGLCALNAWSMRVLGSRLLRAGSGAMTGKTGAFILLFNGKILFIGLIIYFTMRLLPIQLLPFLLGISALPTAILIVALSSLGAPGVTSEESHG